MTVRRGLLGATLWLWALALCGCSGSSGGSKQAAPAIPLEPVAEPTAEQRMADPVKKKLDDARRLLRMVPVRANGALIVDFGQVFTLVQDVERALGHDRHGRQFFSWAQALLDSSRVPFPWTARELQRLGIDPARPALVFEDRREVLVLPIKDEATLKARLSVLARREPWDRWKEEFVDGLRIQVCGYSSYRQVACRKQDGYLICARGKEQLLRTLKGAPYRSQWVTLSKADREHLSTAAALIFFKDGGARGRGTVRVEADGLSARLKVNLRRLSRLVGSPPEGEPALLGLAKGARTDFFARLPLDKIMGSVRGLSATMNKAGLGPLKLRAAFSGELLFVDHGKDNKALILASTDRGLTRKLLDVVVAALPSLPTKVGILELPAIKATPVSKAQGGGYRLRVTSRSVSVKFQWSLRLAAARAGLVIGTEAAVKALLQRAPTPAAATRKALTGQVDRAAYGPGSELALRSILRDVEQMLPMKIGWNEVVPSGRQKPHLLQLIQAGRFALDQLHRVTVGLSRKDGDTVVLVGRITTLHRRGVAGDDEARALWARALKAKYQGDGAAHKTLSGEVARRFSRSRFGQRAASSNGGLDAGGAAAITLLGGVAAPYLLARQYRNYTAEATEGLDKIKAGARMYFISDHYDTNGNLLPKQFPKSVPRTPAKPPCGRAVATPAAQWKKVGWRQMHFAITEPHRYAFSFDSSGTNTKAVFTAKAFGDLDCDGVYSTYEMRGSVDSQFGVRTIGPIITNGVE